MWLACAGSLAMNKGLPESSSKYADEGSAAHQLAAWCLDGWNSQASMVWPAPAAGFIGRVITIGEREFVVDDEMARHVQVYVDNIALYADGADEVLVEHKVNYSSHLGLDAEHAWGTGDVIIVKGNELQSHDLKYGQGEEVDADTPQLKLYLLGALSHFDLEYAIEHARGVIHQVRKDPRPKDMSWPLADLLAWAKDHAAPAADKADIAMYATPEELVGMLTPGEKQCRWCKAKATCPALREEVALQTTGAVWTPMAADEFDALKPIEPDATTSAEYLAMAMSKVDLVEHWCTAVRAEAERRLLTGTPVPGYKLVQGRRGARAWTDATAAEALLKSFRLKVEQMYDLKVISPTSAEKVLAESPKRWKKAQALISQSEGKASVAPASDKRPALEIAPVADEFSDLGAAGGEQPASNDFADLA